ncbi:acyl carrier protein [Streptomyces johnsoniae]|uniref:Phosphopantetheine-binding protein n=1 Tax=Streptomyces johnsoniae TaxID=3075532 RepID=A0ABU2S7N3_9ACTN|nr:phosphopantetheine-binding protein [Streptomyces sp. DSM 41886]MDT0444125.1 phosphopantetheine-binding protein [Streptomyces sp. DSM 41886]
MTAVQGGTDGATVEKELTAFLAEQTGTEPAADQDLFATGVISSMFALQLVVHLEDEYDIEIVGPELSMDNFRSVRTMSALVLRLQDADTGSRDE